MGCCRSGGHVRGWAAPPSSTRWTSPRLHGCRIESLRDLIEVYDREINELDRRIATHAGPPPGLPGHPGHPGVGPILAAVFVAEIGDITRFPSPASCPRGPGMTPRHRESDTKVRRGRITKQGSRLVRWAAVEAVSRTTATARSKPTTDASPSGGVATSPGWPPPARCSPSSTTDCATERSAASREPNEGEQARTQPADSSGIGMTPRRVVLM